MYNNNSDKPTNVQIKSLYSPGYSSLMMSYFRRYLTLDFALYTGKDDNGFDQYSREIRPSTSLDPDGAAFFYMQAYRILEGKVPEEQPIEVVLHCRNDTKLTFAYRPDENNQMGSTTRLE